MSDVVWLHGTGLAGVPFGPHPAGRWLTLPGHGTRPATEGSVRAMAEALLPDLPERFAVVGHSLGGMVGLQLAHDHPQRCRALVMVDVPLWVPKWILPGVAAKLAPWNTHALARDLSARIVAARTGNRAVRPAVRRAIRSMSGQGLARAAQAACRFDGRALLAGLRVPALAILGARSILTDAAMQTALEAAPSVRITTLNTGHMVPFDDPAGFDAAVTQFLESHP